MIMKGFGLKVILKKVHLSRSLVKHKSLCQVVSAIYDLKPWVSTGENNLQILMDIDDRRKLHWVLWNS